MDAGKKKNLVLLAVLAVALGSVNLLAWLAAARGAIPPIDNLVLWSGFAVINAVSILWATSMLGLQPIVVALAYAGGGFLAFRGVANMSGMGIAEMTTAGATCGAFGAMTIGNALEKMRLAFFNRKQTPFMFIILFLLVADALLSSMAASGGGAGLLRAIVIPFVLAGIMIGASWSLRFRLGFGRLSDAQSQGTGSGTSQMEADAGDANADSPLFQIPELQSEADVFEPMLAVAESEPAEEVKSSEQEQLEDAEPVVDAEPAVVDKPMQADAKAESADLLFFPLEIDSGLNAQESSSEEGDESILPAMDKSA